MNSCIIYYVLTIVLDVSSMGIHRHLLTLVIYYSTITLYCLQLIVLGNILMNLTQGMSETYEKHIVKIFGNWVKY
jgi:hypothetical protein